MAQLAKLLADFRRAEKTFPWADFVRLITKLGYEEIKRGGGGRNKTGGSRVRFRHPVTNDMIWLDKPHDGEMTRGMIDRLKKQLDERGLL